MNNEEFQNIVLEKFSSLDKRFDKLEVRFDKLEARFDKFEKQVNKKFDAIDKQFKSIDKRFDASDKRFDILESQVKENTQILKALTHSAEVNKAEHDRMMINITHVQGDVSEMKKDLSIVQTITANNYADVVRLKALR